MAGALEPAHAPGRRHAFDDTLHELAPAEPVAGAVEAQHRDADRRQVSVAQLFRLAVRMQRIGEEEQAVAGEALRREHRREAPAHRSAAEDEPRRPVAAPRLLHGLGEGGLQPRHWVGTAAAARPVGKVEAHDVEAAAGELRRERLERPVGLVAAGAVAAHEQRPGLARGAVEEELYAGLLPAVAAASAISRCTFAKSDFGKYFTARSASQSAAREDSCSGKNAASQTPSARSPSQTWMRPSPVICAAAVISLACSVRSVILRSRSMALRALQAVDPDGRRSPQWSVRRR